MFKTSRSEIWKIGIWSLFVIWCLIFGISSVYAQDRIVAVVNNEVITLSDLNKATTLMFAGVDKQQGRIVMRDQGRGGHDFMAPFAEKLQERRSDPV